MLGTKAETLRRLENKLNTARILPQYAFTVAEWLDKRAEILDGFARLPWSGEVIVRSSALQEDTENRSWAGKYKSVPGVCGEAEFVKAVGHVIASYDDCNPENQILVQPMLNDVRLCGVAFTLDPNTLGNYYVVNYDETGSTSAVTSGGGQECRLYYRFKKCILPEMTGGCVTEGSCGNKDDSMGRLCTALRELEGFFGRGGLDVEFAFAGKEDALYVLQVRSLCLGGTPADLEGQARELARIEAKIRNAQTRKPFLCGGRTVYSVMTDWNPAEMIGVRPKPLALSLYRELITDSVWAYQRDNYGYRNLRSFPLMVDFAGLPYIDVRVSFNSFIPAGLEESLSEKLADYYISELEKHPEKHDKAEFEVVFSCYTLDLPRRINILKDHGFSEEDIQKITAALREVTNRITDYKNGLWRRDAGKIETLSKRYEEIMGSGMGDMEKVYWLLEDCKRYGTLPFAGLARAAFIAVQMLRSFVSCGIFSEKDYEAFMGGVETVSTAMSRDRGELSRGAFLRKYGHLRPGTYDITSRRYDEAPELYFDSFVESGNLNIRDTAIWNAEAGNGKTVREGTSEDGTKNTQFRLSLRQLRLLEDALRANGLANDVLDILEFIKRVIEGREYGKFVFTRSLSEAMRLIGRIGESMGISREDCAYLNIRTVYELYVSTKDAGEEFRSSIKRGKRDYELTKSIVLPPVITRPEQAYSFYYPDSEPNFITSLKAVGDTWTADSGRGADRMCGKILLIPSADPGYDWIFSRGIAGFVTMYGGANSHMAIRAGELGIPAAVGVGEKAFARYKGAETLEIDAANKTIRTLR